MERAACSFPKKIITLQGESTRNRAKSGPVWWSLDLRKDSLDSASWRGFPALITLCLSVCLCSHQGCPAPLTETPCSQWTRQANPRNSEDFQRGCACLCDGSTVPAGNQAQAMLSGRGGQKRGVWAERTAGNLQENLLAGNVMNTIAEEKQAGSCCWEGLPRERSQAEGGVNLSEISLSLLSSPGFKKQIFCHIEVATSSGGCAPSVCSVRKDEPLAQVCHWLTLSSSKPRVLDFPSAKAFDNLPHWVLLESTCLCLQNTEFCLIQRCLCLAFSTSKDTMDYFEDGRKRHWTSLLSACLCLLSHLQPHIFLGVDDSKQILILIYGLN